MAEKKKKRSAASKMKAIRIADGLLSVASLVSSLRIISFFFQDQEENSFYALLAYLFIAASKVLQGILIKDKSKLTYYFNMVYAVLMVAAGIVIGATSFSTLGTRIYMFAFSLILIANRALAIHRNRRVRNALLNALLILVFSIYASAVILLDSENTITLLMIHVFAVFMTALVHIIAISFSQMRIDVMLKIIRKTFALEILFGLALLIISFSFVFQTLEPGMENYGDALWYCFAVVTTIGFGDMTVVTGIARALSVILGIYGIVVVALITSIIVNFYSEVKDSADDEDEEEPDDAAEAEETPKEESKVKP